MPPPTWCYFTSLTGTINTAKAMDIFDNIMWVLFVISSSVMEAYIFHGVTPWSTTRINRHVFLQITRVVVFVGFFGINVNLLLYLLPHGLMFPFLHDGIYYSTRHSLNPSVYKLGWRDTSTTTDARFSFGYKKRKTFFILGGLIWIFYLLVELLLPV